MKHPTLLALLMGLVASCSQSSPDNSSDEMPPITVATATAEPTQQPITVPAPTRLWRVWTFKEDCKVGIQSGGAISFREGGKLEGDFIRSDGDVVVIKLIDGGNAQVPVASLSDVDQEMVRTVAGIAIREEPLDQEASRRKAAFMAQSQAILEQKSQEEAREIARFNADKAAKEEEERKERERKLLFPEPEPYFPSAVRGPWPQQGKRH